MPGPIEVRSSNFASVACCLDKRVGGGCQRATHPGRSCAHAEEVRRQQQILDGQCILCKDIAGVPLFSYGTGAIRVGDWVKSQVVVYGWRDIMLHLLAKVICLNMQILCLTYISAKS